MTKELELWHFVAGRLKNDCVVMLLVVAESFGSSPGRAGYKMVVSDDGELVGSIGGGVMEVGLVEQAHATLGVQTPQQQNAAIKNQVHQKNADDASGMICSGRQTVILKSLISEDAVAVDAIIAALANRTGAFLTITSKHFSVMPPESETPTSDFHFDKLSDVDFRYSEKLGHKNELFIVGGGHCALALSELMSRMDFHISLFDDRPDLNTVDKNRFANAITMVESYDNIGELIPSGENNFVVVMTLGYKSDEIVIRSLLGKDLKYFGVLGSQAKMKTLLRDLEKDGVEHERLTSIRTPIGLAINSRTPEEIAVSIAAEIIAVKNESERYV